MDKNLLGREVKIEGKEGEITNILGVGYEVTFFNVSDGKTYIGAKEIEKYLVPPADSGNPEMKNLKVVDFEIKANGGFIIKYSNGCTSILCKEQLIAKLNQRSN